MVIGQYTDGVCSGRSVNSYRDEPGVPKDSMRDTFAAIKCEINNQRWSGVPFIVKAGKAMTKSCTEIIIKFKDVVGSIHKLTSPSQQIRYSCSARGWYDIQHNQQSTR